MRYGSGASGVRNRLLAMILNSFPRWAKRSLIAGQLSLAFVTLGPANLAFAQARQSPELTNEERSHLRHRFQEGLAQQAAGNWAQALTIFKEIAETLPTPQVRFNIAWCEEKLGQLVAALGDYQLAAADARAKDAPNVLAEAEASLKSLQQRVPRLKLRRGAGASSATIRLDGVRLGESALARPVPLDPGPHLIVATAPGYLKLEQEVRLSEGETETVVVELQRPHADIPPPPVAPSGESSNLLAYTIGGIGVASLVASGVFFLLRQQRLNQLEETCSPTACPESARGAWEDGKRFTLLGNITAAVGATGVGVGAVILLTDTNDAPSGPLTTSRTTGSYAGLEVVGSF